MSLKTRTVHQSLEVSQGKKKNASISVWAVGLVIHKPQQAAGSNRLLELSKLLLEGDAFASTLGLGLRG